MMTNSLLAATTLVAALAAPVWAGHEGCGGAGAGLWLAKPLLLATMALGYWVLRTAKSDAGMLRRVGQIVGWVVLLGSIAALACGMCGKKGCPLTGGDGLHKCGTHEAPAADASATPAPAKKR